MVAQVKYILMLWYLRICAGSMKSTVSGGTILCALKSVEQKKKVTSEQE